MSGSLTHGPNKIIQYALIALGHGTLPSAGGSWPVFNSNLPDDPDQIITVYNTQGREDGFSMIDGTRLEHHGFEIMLRSNLANDGYTKARQIAIALDRNMLEISVTVGASIYLVNATTRTGDINQLGKESPASKRHLFSINALVALTQTT